MGRLVDSQSGEGARPAAAGNVTLIPASLTACSPPSPDTLGAATSPILPVTVQAAMPDPGPGLRTYGLWYWRRAHPPLPRLLGRWTRSGWQCRHRRRPSECVPCGGACICRHGRRRHRCADCDGRGVCKHGRRRSRCAQCPCSSRCVHGRERGACRPCRGSEICHHAQRRSCCVACGGGGVCDHGRRRGDCPICRAARLGAAPPRRPLATDWRRPLWAALMVHATIAHRQLGVDSDRSRPMRPARSAEPAVSRVSRPL
jgi:hypothetical protein